MSTALLLDALFGVIALLFVPIGLRRGIAREVVTTAAILTGAQLSASWARPWGADLAGDLNLRSGIGQFVISALFLFGATLLLGYGGGAALRPPESRIWGRLAGVALAVINGALLAAFVLRDIERFLTDAGTERALEQSRIARTLLDRFGWVTLAAAAVMIVPVVIGVLRGRRADRALAPSSVVSNQWYEPPAPASTRKPRLAWGNDEGKVEPSARAFDPANGRYGADSPSLQATMPLAPVEGSYWSSDRARATPARGNGEWLDIGDTRHANWPVPVASPEKPAQALSCQACGELMTEDDMFCPACGRARRSS